jgi:hypothetical protein
MTVLRRGGLGFIALVAALAAGCSDDASDTSEDTGGDMVTDASDGTGADAAPRDAGGGGDDGGGGGDGGGDGGGGDAAVAPDAGTDGGPSTGPGGGCGCDPTAACLRVTVDTVDDPASQPWVLWPEEADGVGTLHVVAMPGVGGVAAIATVDDWDVNDAGTLVEAELCVSAGPQQLGGFLDDNVNAAADALRSSDYLDSCATPATVTATAGGTHAVTLTLSATCD